jgi:hypothetical protein
MVEQPETTPTTSPDEETKKKKKGPNKEKLTQAILDKKQKVRPHRQETIWDDKQPGLCALISRGPADNDKRGATISLRACYYLKSKPGKPQYLKLGRYPDGEYRYKENDEVYVISCDNLDAVRDRVAVIRAQAKNGINPKRVVPSGSFAKVVEDFLDLHAKKKNRSWKETDRIFRIYVLPQWHDRKIGDITRKDVTELLDMIEAGRIKTDNGKKIGTTSQADATLAQLSKLFNWHAIREDDFQTPIVKGMQRGKSMKERARARVLTDEELQIMWPLLDELGPYGAVVKCALLTAQRFHKVSTMRRRDLKAQLRIDSEMDDDGNSIPAYFIPHVWDASRVNDPKNKSVSAVPLSAMARQIIDSVPVIDGDADYVFSLNGDKPIQGFSGLKLKLDAAMRAKLGDEFKPWQHRDLRRTARTLMQRAKVSREISERCLGHALPTIEGTYNRHTYLSEKRDAFAKLAEFVSRILNPADNVVTHPRAQR